MSKDKLPEFKSKPIIGVPEEEWHKWTMGKIAHLEAMNDPEVRKNMSEAAKKRHKDGWASPVKYEWTLDNNPNKGGNKGRENPTYGKGALYKEIKSGFTGTFLQMKQKFPGFSLGFVKRKKIRKDSPYPDCVWIRVRDSLMSKNNHPEDFSERVKQGKSKMQIEVFFNSKSLGFGNVSFAAKTASISEWSVYSCIKKNIPSSNGYCFKKLDTKE